MAEPTRFTVNAMGFELPPPGVGLVTTRFRAPSVADSADRDIRRRARRAVRRQAVHHDAGPEVRRRDTIQEIVPAQNDVQSSDSGSPATGVTELRTGTGYVTVKPFTMLSMPPPGGAFFR